MNNCVHCRSDYKLSNNALEQRMVFDNICYQCTFARSNLSRLRNDRYQAFVALIEEFPNTAGGALGMQREFARNIQYFTKKR